MPERLLRFFRASGQLRFFYSAGLGLPRHVTSSKFVAICLLRHSPHKEGMETNRDKPRQSPITLIGALSVPGKNLLLGEVGGDEHRTVVPLGCVYYEVEALALLSVVVYLHLHSQLVYDGESGVT